MIKGQFFWLGSFPNNESPNCHFFEMLLFLKDFGLPVGVGAALSPLVYYGLVYYVFIPMEKTQQNENCMTRLFQFVLLETLCCHLMLACRRCLYKYLAGIGLFRLIPKMIL